MKSNFILLLLILPFLSISRGEEKKHMRQFIDQFGRKLEAEIIEIIEGDRVKIKARGKYFTFPFNKFSEKDRIYLAFLRDLETGIKGKFIAAIDDRGKIWLNGEEVLQANKDGIHKSEEISIKSGDSLVVDVKDLWHGGYFKMIFVESGSNRALSFTIDDFKVIEDGKDTKISQKKFDRLKHHPIFDEKRMKSNSNPFSMKNESQWIWWKEDHFRLGAILSREMLMYTFAPKENEKTKAD